MQAGEVIWLLVGIAIGLVTAMLLLAGMLMIDGRRLRGRRVEAAAPVAPKPDLPVAAPLTRPDAVPPRTVPPVPEIRRWLAREPRQPLAPMPPPEPVRAAEPPRPAENKSAEPEPDELSSALAAEIARVQVIEPVEAIALPPPVEPVPVEPEPTPPIVLAAEPPVPDPAPAPVVDEPPPAVQAPKVAGLPKVTPARKFAPALPPRNPPAQGS